MWAALEVLIEKYNEKCKDTCAKLTTSAAGSPLVAICSPLMKRVHTTRRSGELCFIDSSGCMDRENCRVFLLLTHSCAGGLPLGIILSQSEDEDTIAEGLELLKELLPENAFDGNARAGPSLFITDDSKAERGALRRAFPEATLLLCTFHLLQAVWRWLRCNEHGISKIDRQAFYAVVKDMLYAEDVSGVELLYQNAISSTAVRFVQCPKCFGRESTSSGHSNAPGILLL